MLLSAKLKVWGTTNVFTTGNLAWTAFFFGADKSQHTAAVNYMILTISFVVGAIVSALLQKIWVLKTIWIAVVLLAAINFIYLLALKSNNKLNFKNE